MLGLADDITQTWTAQPYTSVAVLARTHDSLRRLSVLLNDRQIPISYEQQNNILDSEVVQLIYKLALTVQAIAAGDQSSVNLQLATLLRYPVWNISSVQLWQLATKNFGRGDWLNSLLEHDDESLVSLSKWLLWLAQLPAPLPLMMEYLLGLRAGEVLTSPIRAHYLALPLTTSYMEALSALQLLTALSLELSGNETGDLGDFIRFIDLNTGLERAVTDQSWFTTGDKAVQLMTVHKSKGLEFDSVYLLDANEDGWKPRNVSRKPPANLPLQPYGEQYDDYVRLLYVAATRAKSSLIISSYGSNEQGAAVQATPLVTNALDTALVSGQEVAELVTVLESALRWPRLETADERALLAGRLDDFSLNATALISFLDVTQGGPQTFLEDKLLKLPSQSSTALQFGNAVHAGLQAGQLCVNNDQPVLPGVLDRFASSLAAQHMQPEDYERFLTHGQALLADLFTNKSFSLPKGGLAEISLTDVYLGEARIGGKLDHVMQRDQTIIISDYKTGKPLSSFTTRDQTKAVKAWRHRTQLLFYNLLVSGSSRFSGVHSIKSQMLYIEAPTSREFTLKLTPTQEEMERIEALAVAVWRHIMNLNFPSVSQYPQTIAGVTAFEDDLIHNHM